jgi:predicted N-formylglutamate amidohydrolase
VSDAFLLVPGTADTGLLVVVDHASNHVPADLDLGAGPGLLEKHIGWDIGAAALGGALCERFGCPGLFGGVSRLVIDLHREEDSPALIPASSDGHAIPGNDGLSAVQREARLDRFWRPYHRELAGLIADQRPSLIVAVHSFTPRLQTADGPERPWQVGILYNQDARAAAFAIAELRRLGLETGDNEPYSGKLLNATMNMHAEAHAIPYLAIEVRNDLIGDMGGVERWAGTLDQVIRRVRDRLGQAAPWP